MHRQQFTYTCKLQQRDDDGGTRGAREGGEGKEERRIPLTMARQRQVYGAGGVRDREGDRITAFPVAYCYTLGICAPPDLPRYVSRLTRNATCRTKALD